MYVSRPDYRLTFRAWNFWIDLKIIFEQRVQLNCSRGMVQNNKLIDVFKTYINVDYLYKF